jgi:hypothetical protein
MDGYRDGWEKLEGTFSLVLHTYVRSKLPVDAILMQVCTVILAP